MHKSKMHEKDVVFGVYRTFLVKSSDGLFSCLFSFAFLFHDGVSVPVVKK